jgi:RNA polymerase sigma factor (sigma-70 family)
MNPTPDSPSGVDSLFARARAGDETAWGDLFRECYPKVVRVVRRKLNRPMRSLYDSTDFASDVMKSLAANAGRLDFDSFGSLMSFLVRVAEQKVIDEYRRVHTLKRDIDRQSHLGAHDDEGGGTAVAIISDDPTASQVAVAGEAHERLLAGQDEVKRQVIELKHQGYSVSEIAEETGWNIRKVQRFLKALGESFGHTSDEMS